MTKYREEIVEGEAAFAAGEARNANPYPCFTTEWYAWDAGWGRASEAATPEEPTTVWSW